MQTTSDARGQNRVYTDYGAWCKNSTVSLSTWPVCGGSGFEAALDDFGTPMDIVGLPVESDSSGTDNLGTGAVAFATFDTDSCGANADTACADGGLKVTLDGGATWYPVVESGTPSTSLGGGTCDYDDFFSVRSEVAIDPRASSYDDTGTYNFRLFITGESNSNGTCGLVEVEFDQGDLVSGAFEATWTTVAIPSACKIDGGNLSGVLVNPWLWTSTEAERVIVWGAWQNRSGTPWGGACSIKTDGTNPLFVLDPANTAHYFDVDDVVPHPWIDRVFVVQPSVKAVTRVECGASCSKPVPFLAERLRALGASDYGWVETDLSTTGLQGLRGAAADVDWYAGDPTLYYATSGSGVHSTAITW
ncbi:MAG: hypothetical protein ACOZNI_15970 [Myxococcota bacterium]